MTGHFDLVPAKLLSRGGLNKFEIADLLEKDYHFDKENLPKLPLKAICFPTRIIFLASPPNKLSRL